MFIGGHQPRFVPQYIFLVPPISVSVDIGVGMGIGVVPTVSPRPDGRSTQIPRLIQRLFILCVVIRTGV